MIKNTDKILIIGSSGMLGKELGFVFSEFSPILWTRSDLDITSEKDVRKKIFSISPDIIINAAAYTDVNRAETERDKAFLTNSDAVRFLAKASCDLAAKFVHFSTDYVFDGKNETDFSENCAPNPLNEYGRSKLSGEMEILKLRETGLEYYIIRTSWLFGFYGKNFVKTMLSAASDGKSLKVVDDQFGSPTYAKDLARSVFDLIDTEADFGIYHRTNSGFCSWYEFAREIFNVFEISANLNPCKSEEYQTPAIRPKKSILLTTKLPELRRWREALCDFKKDFQNRDF